MSATPFMPPLAEAIATKFVKLGGHVIFFPRGSKRCTEDGWEHLATNDVAVAVERARRNPDFNVGLVGKQDGLWAVDIDDRAVANEIAQLEKQHGTINTYATSTVSGGLHLIFRQNTASWEMGNIAVKGENGKELLSARVHNRYVVLAGGWAHPRNDVSLPLSQYTALNPDAPIAEAPQWLLDYIKAKAQTDGKKQTAPQPEVCVGEGGRNNYLTSVAGKMRQNFGWDFEKIKQELRLENEGRCNPPLSESEVDSIARSVSGYAVQPGDVILNQKPDAGAANLNVITADKVQPKKVRWLWDKRVPFGKLTVFAGNPDEAKSLVSLYAVAQLTTGQKMFESDIILPPSEVLIMAAEDEPNDTIVPRLMAAQADLSKVHILQSVVVQQGQGQTESEREVQLDTDTREIEKFVAANPNIRLIIIDPISSYLGDVKMGGEKEIRRLLNPLRTFAARTGIAIVMIMHFNKSVDASAIHRIGGAVAFTGVARAVWAFMSDPNDQENPHLRKMLKVKANLAATSTGGLTYEVKTRAVQIEGDFDHQPYVVFVGRTDKTASDLLMGGRTVGRPDTEKKDAKQWLEDFMSRNGAETASDVERFGKKAGHTLRTLKRAKEELGYPSEQVGRKWYWKLPNVSLEFNEPVDLEAGSPRAVN